MALGHLKAFFSPEDDGCGGGCMVVDVSKPALRAPSPPSEGREGALHVRAHEALQQEWKAAGLSSVLERNKGGFGNDLSDRTNTMELFLW